MRIFGYFCVMLFFNFQTFCLANSILIEAKHNLLTAKRITSVPNNVKWEVVLQKMKRDIGNFKSVLEAIEYGQFRGSLGFDHRAPTSVSSLALQEKSLIAEFPEYADSIRKICESPLSMFCTDYSRRRVSNMLYYHYRYLLQTLKHVSDPKVVCQIGGGYGDVERLWLINPLFNPDVCIIIDFPECLFFAEVFLKANVKDVEIVYLKGGESLTNLSANTVILCPIGLENTLTLPIDLVINTGSMQEMTDSWVDHWMQWLDRTNVRYFYSLNYGADSIQSRPYEVMGATTWAPRLSSKWSYELNNAPSFLEVYSGFAEILALKNFPTFTSEELKHRFDMCWKERSNEKDAFLECLDVVRLLPDPELIWELIGRIFHEMSFVPRETYYLFKLLKQHASPEFLQKNQKRLREIERYLGHFTSDLRE